MIKIIIFALLAFASTILWNRMGILIYLTTGYKGFSPIAIDPKMVLPWKMAGLFFIIFLTFLFIKLKIIAQNSLTRITGIILFFFFYSANQLILFQSILYKSNFLINFKIVYFLATIIFIYLFFLIIVDLKNEWVLIIFIFLVYFYFYLITLTIPIDAYSDMFKVIDIACLNFLSGKSPYIFRGIECDHNNCPYLPGLWLAFLPFKMLNIDLRIGNLFYMFLFLLVTMIIIKKENRYCLYCVALLTIFFTNPWLIFRYDIYYGIIFLLMTSFVYYFNTNKNMAAFFLGVLLATHQIGIIIFIMWLSWEYRILNKKIPFKIILISLLTFFLIIIFFLIQNPSGFLKSTYFSSLFHWQSADDFSHYNLAAILPRYILIIIQILILMAGIYFILNKKDLEIYDFFKVLAIVIGIFLLNSSYNPHYMYFLFIIWLFYYEIFRVKKNLYIKKDL